MSSNNKTKDGGEEESSQNTPHAITITIMETSSMDGTTFRASGLEATTIRPTIVSSSETQDAKEGSESLLVVSGNDDNTVSVTQSTRDLLQTVTETHMGSEELPVISNISSSEDVCDQSTIQIVTKTGDIEIDRVDVAEECEGGAEISGHHCLICNEELQEEQIPVFKTLTATSQRKVSVYLGILVGQKLTSRKVHSDIICQKCFNILNKLDLLEVDIRDTKNELVNKYQETVAVHGGRARRRKPAAAKNSDFVFTKIEPDDDDEQAISMEMDETFEPKVDDLLDEEHDRREDRDSQDEEWEPEYKRTRVKREASESDPRGPPKRKRGRPRKDAAKSKTHGDEDMGEGIKEIGSELGLENRLSHPESINSRHLISCEEDISVTQALILVNKYGQQQEDSCPFCSKALPRASLCLHIQEQHAEYVNECNVCKIKFASSSSFNTHYESHTTGTHVCLVCDVKFETWVELLNHNNMRHVNNYKSKFSCHICGNMYTHRSKFINHVAKYHRGKIEIEGLIWGSCGHLVCQVCQKKFKRVSLYISHEKFHRNKRLYCHLCPNSYASVSLLQDHILSHQFGNFECSKCHIKFVSLLQLNLHEEKTHDGVNSVCQYCNKKFQERVQLVCHRRKEHPESLEAQKAKYNCVECGMKFAVRGNLVRHLKMHKKEKDAKPYECDLCGKILSNKYSLAAHKKSHSGGTFRCSLCDKSFVTKYTLLEHMKRIHDDFGYGRDKVCNQCGRSFFKNSELEYHIKTHTGERPYRCEVCGETYLSSSTLRYHMQKHSNTVFVCQVCHSKFKNYVGWSAHVRRVHGVTSVREYTKEHGIMQAVVEKDTPSMYIVAPSHSRSVDGVNNIVSKDPLTESLNSTSLDVGLEETVVSMPGKEADNIVHVVSCDDLANPMVHTVDAEEVSLSGSTNVKSSLGSTSETFTTEIIKNKLGVEGDSNYSQSSEKGQGVIPEGWELILQEENEESRVAVAEEWESAHIIVPESVEEQHMVLSNDWDREQGMTELVVKEETQVVISSWKDCVDYE